jgi:hypothetical protein
VSVGAKNPTDLGDVLGMNAENEERYQRAGVHFDAVLEDKLIAQLVKTLLPPRSQHLRSRSRKNVAFAVVVVARTSCREHQAAAAAARGAKEGGGGCLGDMRWAPEAARTAAVASPMPAEAPVLRSREATATRVGGGGVRKAREQGDTARPQRVART